MTPFARLIRLLTPAEAPVADYPFVASDVALYRSMLHGGGGGQGETGAIDAQTWDDLLLPQYSAQLARETSIFGQQELHRRLHADTSGGAGTGGAAGADGAADTYDAAGEVEASAVGVRTLAQDAERRQALQAACTGLRRADREISVTLFGPAPAPTPRWVGVLAWLPVGFLLSVVLALASGFLPLWGVALVLWLALMAVQVRFHEQAEEWERVLRSMSQMLRAHTLLAATDDTLADPFRDDAARAGKINRGLAPSPLAGMPGVRDYSDWLWLKNIRHYFRSRETVRVNGEFLRASFQRVAALDADLSLARHLAQTPRYCWAERGDDVSLTQVVHPLLAEAAPLTFGLEQRGAFISGQNGVGKSTLLRTVGLNLIAARAFGFCYADQARTPLLPVYSSMQSEDALESGESLYIAELRRARELLALAERAPAIFIIDEIFRGTNHLESISAATAVLHTLSASGKVIVSSHNLVLASLLADCLTPLCVGRADGALQLAPGVLKETNGIALLGTRGFDDAISAKANRVFGWLSDYMAHPVDCEAIRGALHAEL
jgi:hypothetical protein